MTPAIRPLDRDGAPLLARAYLADEPPSPLAAVMAHVPELLDAAMPFMAAVYGPTALPERLKEIVVLRTSARNGCRYCMRLHAGLAAAAGLDPSEIDALRTGALAPSTFDARERAACTFADAMCDAPAGAVAPLTQHFRDDEIVELAMLAGTTTFLNRFCTAMGLA